MNFRVFILLLFIFGIVKCTDTDVIYKVKKNIPKEGWYIDDALTFNDVSSTPRGEIFLRVYHSEEYGFENIYLKAIVLQGIDTLFHDVFSVPLMDDSGLWMGERARGFRFVEYPISEIKTNNKVFTVDIFQHSREEVLSGISSVEFIARNGKGSNQ